MLKQYHSTAMPSDWVPFEDIFIYKHVLIPTEEMCHYNVFFACSLLAETNTWSMHGFCI